MKLIQLHITKTVLYYITLVLLALLGLYTVIDFIAELEDIGRGQYFLIDIIYYTFLSAPKRIYELLPIAALIGSVLGLGQLSSQSELIVLRAAGISVIQISRSVVFSAILLMTVIFIIGEIIVPVTEKIAKEAQSSAKRGVSSKELDSSFWTRDGSSFIYIDSISPNQELNDITIYQFSPNQQLIGVMTAEKARYANKKLMLSRVIKNKINDAGITRTTLQSESLNAHFNPNTMMSPEFLSILELDNHIELLTENHQAVAKYQMVFWTRIMTPLSTAVMVFLAVPFVFGSLRTVSMGNRVVAASLVGIGFYLLNETLQHLSIVYHMTPWIVAVVPTMIFLFLGYRRVQRLDVGY
ncbi:MAG TPA: LPS export ABC transporter permease LptG [Gammaproteobacteria bacterium]|nr:LPS export ABC transporter permease LptG [Gammaproteobacteria bacterium]